MAQLRWYLTFHGGSEKGTWNNVHSFTEKGKVAAISKVLDKNTLPPEVSLRELRGMSIGPDQNLYVVNAFKDFSQILCFSGSLNADGKHSFLSVFVSEPKAHPFQAVFSPHDGNLYVANQDSLNVTRYYGPGSTKGTPGQPVGDGVFIGSGLEAVRGIAFGPDGNFYVADETGKSGKKTGKGKGTINVYDAISGEFKHTLKDPKEHLDKPVHIRFRNLILYIGNSGNDNLCVYNLRSVNPKVKNLIHKEDAQLDKPSGLAFGNDGKLYVGSREAKQINRYKLSDDGLTATFDKVFIGSEDLEDNPEFLLLFD